MWSNTACCLLPKNTIQFVVMTRAMSTDPVGLVWPGQILQTVLSPFEGCAKLSVEGIRN